MALISKLPNRYPVADHNRWITGDKKDLDPVLLGRMAYMAEANKTKLHVTCGYRSSEEQKEIYQKYLAGKLKMAAKPGTSWHEYGLAVDSSTQPYRSFTNRYLEKYGLCKPIKSEGWHFQPIETSGQTDRKKWAPTQAPTVRHEDMQTLRDIGLSEVTMLYLLQHPYKEALFLKLATGIRTKGATGSDWDVLRWAGLSDSTIAYLAEYKYGAELIEKLANAMR